MPVIDKLQSRKYTIQIPGGLLYWVRMIAIALNSFLLAKSSITGTWDKRERPLVLVLLVVILITSIPELKKRLRKRKLDKHHVRNKMSFHGKMFEEKK